MPVILLALFAVLAGSGLADSIAPPANHSPKLLLTASRLRRLKRDRERQTGRWINFESRVNSVADSPERGFELALYFAVTNDSERGKQALDWAAKHPCETRQTALIADWVGGQPPSGRGCAAASGSFARLRDTLFASVAKGLDVATPSSVSQAGFADPKEMYAAVEYLDTIRFIKHTDLRDSDPPFFSSLPARFLLVMEPNELEHPVWQAHVAALALVGLDPNLEGSQFLQGWAMEDRFTVQDGPGVAYEFLWANPYLPGVSYQNMDPWFYDGKGRLAARSDWNAQACWVDISSDIKQRACPPDWESKTATFGHLTLIPMTENCVEIKGRPSNETTILWKMKPGATISYSEEGRQRTATADVSGMWRVSQELRGKLCLAH